MQFPRSVLLVASPIVVIGAVTARYFVRRARRKAKPGPGIADVDPMPMTQTSGEGIDLDMDTSGPRRQREKLPRRGENIP